MSSLIRCHSPLYDLFVLMAQRVLTYLDEAVSNPSLYSQSFQDEVVNKCIKHVEGLGLSDKHQFINSMEELSLEPTLSAMTHISISVWRMVTYTNQ